MDQAQAQPEDAPAVHWTSLIVALVVALAVCAGAGAYLFMA